MSTPKICPLLTIAAMCNDHGLAKCPRNGCAWWDRLAGSCWIASGADCIREAANQLNALNIILEKNSAFNLASARLSLFSLRLSSIAFISSSLNLYLEAIFITLIYYSITSFPIKSFYQEIVLAPV